MKEYTENLGAEEILYDDKVAKISIVGAGMESHAGVATKMFEALYDAQVNIQMISTSEIVRFRFLLIQQTLTRP